MKINKTQCAARALASGAAFLIGSAVLGTGTLVLAQNAKTDTSRPDQPLVKTIAPSVVKTPAEPRGDVPAVSVQAKGAPVQNARTLAFDHTKAYWSTGADGTDWVRGTSYKANFAADGITMIPFLGSSAPVNHPTSMRLARATSGGQEVTLAPIGAPMRNDNRVVYTHGLVDEVYDIEAGSVEQSFVVHGLPRAGGLELFVATQSELETREKAGEIELRNERGGLRIGRTTVVDAVGHQIGASARVVQGGIAIDVPAEYLATAAFPVVVDPAIVPFVLDADLDDDYRPDVAYDASYDHFMTVYEELFSQTDHDVRFIETTSTGVILGQGYVDGSTDNWGNPRVANNNVANQFLVVAQVGVAGSRVIKGRTFAAWDLAFSAVSTVSGTNTTDATSPEVGGDPSLQGPTFYCVVYEDAYSLLDHDIKATMVDVGGQVFGATIGVDTSFNTLDQDPSISPSNGVATDYHDQRWTIVWQRQYAPGDSDVYASQINWNGTLVTPSFPVDSGTGNDFLPTVSTQLDIPGTSRFAVAWQRHFSTESDIMIKVMEGSTTLASANVSQMEGVAWGKDQILATIDSDGAKFVVAYSELYDAAGSDYDVFESVLYYAGSVLGLQDTHRTVAATGHSEMRPEIVTCHSSGSASTNYMVVYDYQAQTEHDVLGAVTQMPGGVTPTEYCFGSVATCPCGNAGAAGSGCANSVNPTGAHLAATGNALIESDTLVLSASGLPATASSLFFQGNASLAPTAFGDGLRCVNGSTVRLGTKTAVGGNASFPGAGNQHVSVRGSVPAAGAIRYYQSWYRNAAAFCTPSTFNLTNAVEVRWIP